MKLMPLIFIFLAFLFPGCPKNSGEWGNIPNGMVPISDDVKQITLSGADVFGKRPVSNHQLALVDSGLTDAFEAAMKSGYSSALAYAHYRIWTPEKPCVLSPQSQTPSFLIRIDAYDGTIWDQEPRPGIGVVYAAELVRSVGTPGSNPPKGEMIVCPSDTVMRDAVRNGAEHIIIANNDNEYFALTWFHDHYYHPLLPKRDTPDARAAAAPSSGDTRSITLKKGEVIIVRAVK